MIDRTQRDSAAQLVRGFLTGDITSDDLESEWPLSSADPAIEAVGSMVWLFYDDHRPRKMVGREAASKEERTLLNRYAAFLDTDIPYDWPESQFDRIATLGPLVPLTLGLLWPIERRLRAKKNRVDAEMARHGDLNVWPFTHREQWSGEPLPPYVC